MSKARLPDGRRDIVLRVCLLKRVATVEATWDDGIGWHWLNNANVVHIIEGEDFNVRVIHGRESEKFPRATAIAIAARWLKGEYVSVDFSL